MASPWNGKIARAGTALRSTPHKNPHRPHEGILADLSLGTPVSVTAQQGGWLQVKVMVKNKTLTGYVSHELVQRIAQVDREKLQPMQAKGTPFTLPGPRLNPFVAAKDNTAVARGPVFEKKEASWKVFRARLELLGTAAQKEGTDGIRFQTAVNQFRSTFEARVNNSPGGSGPAVDIVMKALELWSQDSGSQWGEGWYDSKDLKLSAPDYAKVPASQYKCNAYVAEVLHQSLGLVFKVHASDQEKGKFFPYQAREWGNTGVNIPGFTVVAKPALGDIWSNGHHTGIFLGTYNGEKLYISARDDGLGLFGSTVQYAHGIQIKYLPDGGVYRRYAE